MQQRCLGIFFVSLVTYQSCVPMDDWKFNGVDLHRKALARSHEKRMQQLRHAEAAACVDQAEPVENISPNLLCSYVARQGDCKNMEDVGIVRTLCSESDKIKRYALGLFDGRCGRDAAVYAAKYLHKEIDLLMEKSGRDFATVCPDAFRNLDLKIRENKTMEVQATTALIVDIEQFKARFAWVGDSRAIVIRNGKVVFSTVDHTPDTPSERERIQAAGATLTPSESSHRTRINGTMAISRILGSRYFLESILIAIPDTATFDLESNDLIVAASDGVWNTMSNDDVALSITRSFMRSKDKIDTLYPKVPHLRNQKPDRGVDERGTDDLLTRAARVIRDEAYLRGSTDNIAAFVAKIN